MKGDAPATGPGGLGISCSPLPCGVCMGGGGHTTIAVQRLSGDDGRQRFGTRGPPHHQFGGGGGGDPNAPGMP